MGSPDTAPFNEPLADAVMLDRVDGLSFEPVLLTPEHGLRLDQVEAAATALRGPLAFIWGPPGTGKTHTLTAVVQSLFEDDKRVAEAVVEAVDRAFSRSAYARYLDDDSIRHLTHDVLRTLVAEASAGRLRYATSDRTPATDESPALHAS